MTARELDLDAIGAPASLQALVAARLDALTAQERRVVTDASVLGASFTGDGLTALGSDPDEVLDACWPRCSARRSCRCRPTGSAPSAASTGSCSRWSARSPTPRQSRRDRKTRHLAAADYLAAQPDPGDDLAVVIARHLLDAVDAAPDQDPERTAVAARACSYLERAATRARRVGAPREAQRLLETALDTTQGDADQARLHLAAAEVAGDAGHPDDARAHAEVALDLFDHLHDSIGAGRAAAALSWAIFGNNAAAVAIAEPRWQALDGVVGAERPRFELARALVRAHDGLGNRESHIQYAAQMVVLAEGLDDPEALGQALGALGVVYANIGAHRTGVILLESAAAIAREHDLPFALTRVLTNLAAFLNSYDLPSALRHAEEAAAVARRAGLAMWVEQALANSAIGLWCSGRLDDVADVTELLPEGVDAASPQARILRNTLRFWLADARGDQLPPPAADDETDNELVLAWLVTADLFRATAAADHGEVVRLAALVVDHQLTSGGLDDDFFLLWPPAVLAALGESDLDLAERLLAPVSEALPGHRSPAVSAQWHRLVGLLAAARGDDPELAETEMRTGIDALAAFGAVGFQAQAQEELGRWLVTQGRPDEAEPLLDAARTTYAEMGASGWLARLEAWHGTRRQQAASSSGPV